MKIELHTAHKKSPPSKQTFHSNNFQSYKGLPNSKNFPLRIEIEIHSKHLQPSNFFIIVKTLVLCPKRSICALYDLYNAYVHTLLHVWPTYVCSLLHLRPAYVHTLLYLQPAYYIARTLYGPICGCTFYCCTLVFFSFGLN
jgi:hypothetical protein